MLLFVSHFHCFWSRKELFFVIEDPSEPSVNFDIALGRFWDRQRKMVGFLAYLLASFQICWVLSFIFSPLFLTLCLYSIDLLYFCSSLALSYHSFHLSINSLPSSLLMQPSQKHFLPYL